MGHKDSPVNTWATEHSDHTDLGSSRTWPSRDALLKRAGIAAGALASVAVIVGIVVVGSKLGGSPDIEVAADTTSTTPAPRPIQAAADTPALHPLLPCEEIQSDSHTQTSGHGNLDTPIGVIVAYEHAYFVERDASTMVDLTIPSKDVAAFGPLDESLKRIPLNTPWCVSVKPTDTRDVFAVDVRFLESDSSITNWPQQMTLARNDEGQWKIAKVSGL